MKIYKPKARINQDLFTAGAVVVFFVLMLSGSRPLWYQILCYTFILIDCFVIFREIRYYTQPLLFEKEGTWYLNNYFLRTVAIERVEPSSNWFYKGYAVYSPQGKRYYLRERDLSFEDWQRFKVD